MNRRSHSFIVKEQHYNFLNNESTSICGIYWTKSWNLKDFIHCYAWKCALNPTFINVQWKKAKCFSSILRQFWVSGQQFTFRESVMPFCLQYWSVSSGLSILLINKDYCFNFNVGIFLLKLNTIVHLIYQRLIILLMEKHFYQ